jgi:hypothetical protein
MGSSKEGAAYQSVRGLLDGKQTSSDGKSPCLLPRLMSLARVMAVSYSRSQIAFLCI